MTVKQFLSQAKYLDARINCRIEEAARLRSKLTTGRIANISGMPRGGNFDWADSVHHLIELEKQIDKEIDNLIDIKKQISRAIDSIEDPQLKTLLEMRYRNYSSWSRIAQEMHYDVKWIWKLHGKALQQIQLPKVSIESDYKLCYNTSIESVHRKRL